MVEVEDVKEDYFPANTEEYHGTLREGPWTVTGLITGCGLMQISGLKNADMPQAKMSLDKLKKKMSDGVYSPHWATHGVGTHKPLKCKSVIGTLGSDYYIKKKWDVNGTVHIDILAILKNLGFKCLRVYPNASHIGLGLKNIEQKLFILTWE